MSGLLQDMRKHWKLGLIVVLAFIGACGLKVVSGRPQPTDSVVAWPFEPTLGGGRWRVFGAVEVTDSQTLAAAKRLAERVAECVGQPLPDDFDEYRWFDMSVVIFVDDYGRAQVANGLTLTDDNIVYVRRANMFGRTPDHVVGSFIHEVIHVILDADHPEVDPYIAKCDRHAGQERYRQD